MKPERSHKICQDKKVKSRCLENVLLHVREVHTRNCASWRRTKNVKGLKIIVFSICVECHCCECEWQKTWENVFVWNETIISHGLGYEFTKLILYRVSVGIARFNTVFRFSIQAQNQTRCRTGKCYFFYFSPEHQKIRMFWISKERKFSEESRN